MPGRHLVFPRAAVKVLVQVGRDGGWTKMSIPEHQGMTPAHGGFPDGPYPAAFPCNELEEVLAASIGVPRAGARIVETLARGYVWIPLPNGGGPDSRSLHPPTLEIEGQGDPSRLLSQQPSPHVG